MMINTILFVTMIGLSRAFINIDNINITNLNPNTFDFQVIYSMEILQLKYQIIDKWYTKFLNELTEANLA